jgi:hypothetical protein
MIYVFTLLLVFLLVIVLSRTYLKKVEEVTLNAIGEDLRIECTLKDGRVFQFTIENKPEFDNYYDDDRYYTRTHQYIITKLYENPFIVDPYTGTYFRKNEVRNMRILRADKVGYQSIKTIVKAPFWYLKETYSEIKRVEES